MGWARGDSASYHFEEVLQPLTSIWPRFSKFLTSCGKLSKAEERTRTLLKSNIVIYGALYMKVPEMLTGVAIGDAFGVGLEMQDRNKLQDITYDRWYNWREGKYAENYTPREYSDDTEHTIGLIEALLSGEPFSEDLLVHFWKREYENDKARKGYPRQGHGSIEAYYNGAASIEQIRESQSRRRHPGNAPVMRAAPLGLLPEKVLFNYSEINANATHPHEEARMGSVFIAISSQFILNGGEHQELLAYCAEKDEFQQIHDKLRTIDAFGLPEELTYPEYQQLCGPQPIKGAGGMIEGLPISAIHTALTAGYILKHTGDPFIGLQRSIQMGGDVDSLASIVVGILGGRYGLSTLPDFMREEVEGVDRLNELAHRFEQYLSQFKNL